MDYQNNNMFGQRQNFGAYGGRKITYNNVFSDDEIRENIAKQKADVGMALTMEDIIESECSHHMSDGTLLCEAIPTPSGKSGNGWVKCKHCGAVWQWCDDINDNQVLIPCDDLISILQTTKALNPDLPPEFCKDYMHIIALIKRVPLVWKNTVNILNQYANEGYNSAYPNEQPWGGRVSAMGEMNKFMYNNVYNPMAAMIDPNMQQAMMQQAMMSGMMGGMNPNMMGGMNPNMAAQPQPNMWGNLQAAQDPSQQVNAQPGMNWFNAGLSNVGPGPIGGQPQAATVQQTNIQQNIQPNPNQTIAVNAPLQK